MALKVLSALDSAKTQYYHFKAIIIAGMGLFTDAYDLFCIPPIMKLLGRIYYSDGADRFQIPNAVVSPMLALALLGTVIGQLVFGRLGDLIGRRRVYGLALMLMVLSSLACGFSICTTKQCVLGSLGFFRFLLGVGIGGDYPLSATIMSEFANKMTRGAFIAAVFSMQGFGILASSTVTMAVCKIFEATTTRDNDVNKRQHQADIAWRLILMLGSIPAAFTYYWRMTMPESARYTALVEQNVMQAAKDMEKVLDVSISQIAEEYPLPPSPPQYPLISKRFLRRHGRDLFACATSWLLILNQVCSLLLLHCRDCFIYELGFEHSMFSAFCNCLYKSNSPLSRAFHVGKQFANPSTEDIVFRAICVNLRQRKWKILEQMAPSLTNSLVNRVVSEFRKSPKLALEFYTWVGENNRFSHSLESSCAIVHLLVNWRRFDDALLLMGNLMSANSVSPLEFLEGLLDSYEICKATPAVFDALVRACTQIGATEGAYDVIQKLKVKGHSVSIHAWNNFLSHLVKLNEIGRFWKLYKEMVSCGYVENVNTFNLVIYALCKECKLEEALSLYYRMLKSGIWPNVVCFNMIINEACQVGDLEFALKLFRKMGVMSGDSVLPNSVTHNCIINGFCKLGRVEFAEEIRYAMIKAGIDCNVRTYATLIDGYARGGSSEEALRLCDEMVKRGLMPNTVVYNSTIHWLFEEGDVEGALFVLSDMIDKRICPDQFTYSILTKGLCRNGCVKQAFKLHNQVLEEHMVGDAYSYNILINYLCKSNNLAAAKQLLSSMIVRGLIPDIITYGTLIDGYCKGGNIEGAVQVYENMKKVEKKPNLVIYNSIINGLCKDASLDAAKSLLEASQRIGLLDAITYNTLINGCFINGKIAEAFAMFSEMRNVEIAVNKVGYNILINFLCKFGCYQQARELMKVMILHGIIPDYVTYTTLVTRFSKNCSPEEVIELHDDMVLSGVSPDNQTYDAIISPLLGEKSAEDQV